MGVLSSKDKEESDEIIEEDLDDEVYYGLLNFGNTCYSNSVLQCLYYCKRFRLQVLKNFVHIQYTRKLLDETASYDVKSGTHSDEDELLNPKSILYAISFLFFEIASQMNKGDYIEPHGFITTLSRRNAIFSGYTQQDAHELFNFILNDMAESLQKLSVVNERNKKDPPNEKSHTANKSSTSTASSSKSAALRYRGVSSSATATNSFKKSVNKDSQYDNSHEKEKKTWIHDLFEGTLTNETKCLNCNSVTYREESFFDISLEIEQNSSVSSCLRNFSQSEELKGQNKFYCDTCASLQDAYKRMKLKHLPRILVLHLKRFKYNERLEDFVKLNYKVNFPNHLKLSYMLIKDGRSSKSSNNKSNNYETIIGSNDEVESFSSQPNRLDSSTIASASINDSSSKNIDHNITYSDDDLQYNLSAVVVHIGSTPTKGHFIAIVKDEDHWILFDDEEVEFVTFETLEACYGSPLLSDRLLKSASCGYILLYEDSIQSTTNNNTPLCANTTTNKYSNYNTTDINTDTASSDKSIGSLKYHNDNNQNNQNQNKLTEVDTNYNNRLNESNEENSVNNVRSNTIHQHGTNVSTRSTTTSSNSREVINIKDIINLSNNKIQCPALQRWIREQIRDSNSFLNMPKSNVTNSSVGDNVSDNLLRVMKYYHIGMKKIVASSKSKLMQRIATTKQRRYSNTDGNSNNNSKESKSSALDMDKFGDMDKCEIKETTTSCCSPPCMGHRKVSS